MAKPNKKATGQAQPLKKRRVLDYPRYGKKGIRRWLPSWRLILGTFLTGVAFVAGLVIAAYVSIEIPQATDFAKAQTSTLYFADGETKLGSFAVTDRKIIDIDTIPKHVGQAIIASEDRSFYENAGVDFKGTLRALVNNLRGGARQGGSTITQQYAENYYMGTTTSYVGKFKEALMAIKLDQVTEKDEILAGYLNTIYFGRGAYGIEVAAQKYFGIPASELTVEQAALLSGVIPSPSRWDPRFDPEKAESRWNGVLRGMVEQGYITQAERDAMVFPQTIEYNPTNQWQGPQGHLLEAARKEVLAVTGMTEDELTSRGVEITTTFDAELQTKLEAAMKTLPEDAPKGLNLGAITIDPHTGGVVAMYGGADYVQTQFNSATQGTAQAGSTFKPFTLIAALEDGISLERDYFSGRSPMTFDDHGKPYKPENFGNISYRDTNLVGATANSINTVYVQVNEKVGPQATVDAAIAAGIPADATDLDPVLSNVLGTASVSTIDMAQAYATFAAQGQRHESFIISKILDSDGEQIYEHIAVPKTAFSKEIGADLTYALSQVVEVGSGKTARAVGHPVAGKTGTSNSNKSAWFVGYTPSYATAVSLSQTGEDGKSQVRIDGFGDYREITGSTVPLDLWTEYMTNALEDKPVEQFPERVNKPAPTKTPTPTPTETEPSEEPEPTEEPQTDVTVPGGLVGSSEGAARGALTSLGLTPIFSYAFSDTVAEGIVISVSPGSGQLVPEGSSITIVVSKGAEVVTPPEPDPTPEPTPDPTETPTPDPSEKPSPEPSQSPEKPNPDAGPPVTPPGKEKAPEGEKAQP